MLKSQGWYHLFHNMSKTKIDYHPPKPAHLPNFPVAGSVTCILLRSHLKHYFWLLSLLLLTTPYRFLKIFKDINNI